MRALSRSILIVDDDPGSQRSIRRILLLDGYQIEICGSQYETLVREDLADFFAILLDRRLPDGLAEELLPQLRTRAPDAYVVVITAYADLEGVITALREGAADYILKPVNPDELRHRLTQLQEQQESREENRFQLRQQEALLRISKTALESHDLATVFQETANLVAQLLKVPFCQILERSAGKDLYATVGKWGWSEETVESPPISSSNEFVVGYTLATEKPVIVEDYEKDGRFRPHSLLVDLGVVSGLTVVIHDRKNHYGVLGVFSDQPRHFRPSEVSFVRSVANILGTAIEQHRAEGELNRFFELSLELACIVTMKGAFQRLNPAAAQLLGYSENMVNQIAIRDLAHPEDLALVHAVMEDLSHGTPVSHFTCRFCCADGSFRWLEWNAIPDVSRGLIYAAARDVTTARQAAEALRSERDFAESLLETAQAVILLLDLKGKIVRFNHCFEELTGISLDEVRGTDFCLRFVKPEVQSLIRQQFLNGKLSSIETYEIYCDLIAAVGPPHPIAWSVKPMRNREGKVSHYLAIGHDLTDLRKAQQQAVQAERLAAIGQMVAGLAHESRNALQRAQACLEMLQLDLEENADSLELINRIQLALGDLNRLYEEVRSYAAPLNLELSRCRLENIWRQSWAQLDLARRGKDITFEECIEMDSTECLVDPHRMGQVFLNLFDNAIAACPQVGQVSLRCVNSLLDHGNSLRLLIRDTGPGVSPDNRTQLFEPFHTTKTKGTGLGLSIVKRIVEAHGGSIELGSSGSGAEFVITLPADDSDSP